MAEAYPDLKANENFQDLQNQLEGTENRISVARERYNEAVEKFNFSIRSFPYSLTNSILLHLKRKEYFKADEKAREVPKVAFCMRSHEPLRPRRRPRPALLRGRLRPRRSGPRAAGSTTTAR